MNNDPLTTVLMLFLMPASVIALTIYFVNRDAAKKATEAVASESESLPPALPLLDVTLDIVMTAHVVWLYTVFVGVGIR